MRSSNIKKIHAHLHSQNPETNFSAKCGVVFWPDERNRAFLTVEKKRVTCKNCLRNMGLWRASNQAGGGAHQG